tara:strand:+ start:3052 stop:3696 length:645 start_codon:yes stop_codon:yes gene_type:complete
VGFVDIHTHQKNIAENVFSIENKYPTSTDFSQPFSIGIHPWFIKKESLQNELLFVQEKLHHKNCMALGECGLDKISEIDIALQKLVFRKQIQLSEEYKKPLIIHCVKAFQDIIEIKKEMKPSQIWVLHGFNKNSQVAERLLKNGIILSFGAGIINHKKLQEVAFNIPISSILLETDTAEIPIEKVYQKMAAIKNINLETLTSEIKQNFKSIFKK